MPTQIYTTPGSFTFGGPLIVVTDIRIWGSGGGGAESGTGAGDPYGGGGGGGFIEGVPTNRPDLLAITLPGGGLVNRTNAGAQTTVSWDDEASFLVAGGGHGGTPASDGVGGTSDSAGNVTVLARFHGGNGQSAMAPQFSGGGGGGAGSETDGGNAAGEDQGTGGTPDGGDGGGGGGDVGQSPGGGGGGSDTTPGAGGADRVEIDYEVLFTPIAPYPSIISRLFNTTGNIRRGSFTTDASQGPVAMWPVIVANWPMSINDTGGYQRPHGDSYVIIQTRKCVMNWPGGDIVNGDAIEQGGHLFRVTNVDRRTDLNTGQKYLTVHCEEFAP